MTMTCRKKHWLILVCSFIATIITSGSTFAQSCELSGDMTISGNFIVGPVTLNLGGGQTGDLDVYVENVDFGDRCPVQVLNDMAALWQSMYQDYVDRGMTQANIRRLYDSIAGLPGSGSYSFSSWGACSYIALEKRIYCGGGQGEGYKYYMAHENMHGWEFEYAESYDGIRFYQAFTHFTNLVYHAYSEAPGTLSGVHNNQGWSLDYLAYGLQNEAEWGSQIFVDWVRGTAGEQVWPYAVANHPSYVAFFDCLWQSDESLETCMEPLDLSLEFASYNPLIDPPQLVESVVDLPSGGSETIAFAQEDSRAIWNVCFDRYKQTATEDDHAVLQGFIDRVAPDLADDASRHYSLMYADANHDGTYDWLCSYTGPGPSGIGNGSYLWNPDNRHGTWSFLMSGKGPADYVEYKPDPFLELPSINGSLAVPPYREWQGRYGSANGAGSFAPHDNHFPWYPVFSANMPSGVDTDRDSLLPGRPLLQANYPNPFQQSTRIAFDLAEPGLLELSVFDMLGKRVATLANGWFSAGTHELDWDASAHPSGLYVYRLQIRDLSVSKSLTLLR